MLHRKGNKVTNGAGRPNPRKPGKDAKQRPPKRRRFIISSRAPRHGDSPKPAETARPHGHGHAAPPSAPAPAVKPEGAAPGTPVAPGASAIDLSETIRTLLHLAHEHGHI